MTERLPSRRAEPDWGEPSYHSDPELGMILNAALFLDILKKGKSPVCRNAFGIACDVWFAVKDNDEMSLSDKQLHTILAAMNPEDYAHLLRAN